MTCTVPHLCRFPFQIKTCIGFSSSSPCQSFFPNDLLKGRASIPSNMSQRYLTKVTLEGKESHETFLRVAWFLIPSWKKKKSSPWRLASVSQSLDFYSNTLWFSTWQELKLLRSCQVRWDAWTKTAHSSFSGAQRRCWPTLPYNSAFHTDLIRRKSNTQRFLDPWDCFDPYKLHMLIISLLCPTDMHRYLCRKPSVSLLELNIWFSCWKGESDQG